MEVRTLEKEQINGLETNHLFVIPEKIKSKINERWFYLYNWIWEKDVKESLERDFLKSIDKFWIVIAILMVIPWFIAYNSWNIIYILALILILNIFFLSYLIFLSIKRSSILRKNAYVVLTNNYISINWNIKNRNDFNQNDLEKINKISSLFEEKIFEESYIKNSKSSLTKKLWEKFSTWFTNILRLWKWNSKNSWQLALVLIVLYLVYAFSLLLIYIIWIFLVWAFWLILNVINKKILLIKWHKITKINTGFENIDNYSNSLANEKDNLTKLLNEAINNDWQDSLLTNINKKLDSINKYALDSINTNVELKKDIESSEFKEMFNYATYNSWIKNQILLPLEQIKTLLLKNLEILNNQNKDIDEQLKDQTDPSKSGPILASKRRVEMRIEEINIHISKMDLYINKLK